MGSSSQDHATTAGAAQGTSSLAPRESAKHTDGPWHLVTYRKSPKKAITTHHVRSNDRTVALIHGDQPWTEPNARLLAAAPDLLEALERTLDWLTSYPGGGALGPKGPYEQARDAIRKALSDGSEARTGGED